LLAGLVDRSRVSGGWHPRAG